MPGRQLSRSDHCRPDIGGFQGNPSAELYLRWFQMSTFLTFYRSHCSNNVEYRAPWTYGEPYLSIIREFLQLRYQLLPYFYTLSWEASQKGYPPVRPLFWSNSDECIFWGVDDAFFLGDALLVCPVFEEGAREAKLSRRESRTVLLPKGRWYSFWDEEVFEGVAEVDIAAPLEQMPLLVRAGTILPLEVGQKLILHLYPPVQGSSEGSLYSDAGDGYGEWRLDVFRMVLDDNGLELTWEQQGDYAFPYERVQLHVHGFDLQQAWVDGKDVAVQGNYVECVPFAQVRLQSS